MWASCSKDKDITNENEAELNVNNVSNISENPSLILGSWNLNKNNSSQNSEKSDTDCKAINIHFLDDNAFYLSYLEKRIKGKYEIINLIVLIY